jgi:hypothetical protein
VKRWRVKAEKRESKGRREGRKERAKAEKMESKGRQA